MGDKVIVLFVALGAFAAAVTAWIVARARASSQINELILAKGKAEERTEGLERQLNDMRAEVSHARAEVMSLRERAVKAETGTQALQEKLDSRKKELDDLQANFKTEFENLANRIFEEKSRTFTDQNKVNLDGVLNPLKERIKDFEMKVDKVYHDESLQRTAMQEQIRTLAELNQHMSREATSLTKAIRGDGRTQGRWGEMVLESILEKSGLTKGREFSVQESHTTSDGCRQKPDVIINLPEARNMIIDSKMSFTAYDRYCGAGTDEERKAALGEHVQSVRIHLKGLSEKKYQNLYGINTPDFVLMFVALEPAFSLAVQGEPSLFTDAFEKNIVIVSPSTLLATLRTVASIWRQQNQNRNAMEIAKQAGDLYDKFVGFVDDLRKVGSQIDTVQKSYSDAMGKLTEGKGNLVRRAENIKLLGAKTAKTLPVDLVEKSAPGEISVLTD